MSSSGKVVRGSARRSEVVAAAPAASPVPAEAAVSGDAAQSTRPRHAAITRNLKTWSSYKTWVEQIRDSWQPDAGMILAGEAAGKVAKK
jgi:hypothetical protein